VLHLRSIIWIRELSILGLVLRISLELRDFRSRVVNICRAGTLGLGKIFNLLFLLFIIFFLIFTAFGYGLAFTFSRGFATSAALSASALAGTGYGFAFAASFRLAPFGSTLALLLLWFGGIFSGRGAWSTSSSLSLLLLYRFPI
jgi:hypothetical protein